MLKASHISDTRSAANARLAIRQCRHGTMIYLRQDAYVGRSFEEYGEYSEGEVDLFRQCLAPGDVALDVGANFGSHTIPMAKFVGPTGFVHAFEPQRILFQLTCGNIALNELDNVRVLPCAVGRKPGSTKIPQIDYGRRNNFGGIAVGGERGEDVEVVTLDGLRLPKIKFIKIDVEGMELEVLLGARETLARCRPILYVENDRVDKADALAARLLETGYRLWWHTPPLYNAENFLGNPLNVFGNILSFNMLGLPQESAQTPQGMREIKTPQDASALLRTVGAATAP
ncbi:MAG TPA: FkbM family methyltransferase [Xanthobacteraceae bacterium]|jgi:FkbM family methyltransferase